MIIFQGMILSNVKGRLMDISHKAFQPSFNKTRDGSCKLSRSCCQKFNVHHKKCRILTNGEKSLMHTEVCWMNKEISQSHRELSYLVKDIGDLVVIQALCFLAGIPLPLLCVLTIQILCVYTE